MSLITLRSSYTPCAMFNAISYLGYAQCVDFVTPLIPVIVIFFRGKMSP